MPQKLGREGESGEDWHCKRWIRAHPYVTITKPQLMSLGALFMWYHHPISIARIWRCGWPFSSSHHSSVCTLLHSSIRHMPKKQTVAVVSFVQRRPHIAPSPSIFSPLTISFCYAHCGIRFLSSRERETLGVVERCAVQPDGYGLRFWPNL